MVKKLTALEKRLSIIRFIAVVLCIVLVCASSWLGENVFAYEIQETKTIREPYKYVTDTIHTYVCYTTTYGDMYHARGCGYLWNSSHETTVYQAEKRGYEPCSKCTPKEKTVLEVTETRYKDVEQTYTVTKEPTTLVWLVGTGGIILLYYISTIGLKKRINNLSAHIRATDTES